MKPEQFFIIVIIILMFPPLLYSSPIPEEPGESVEPVELPQDPAEDPAEKQPIPGFIIARKQLYPGGLLEAFAPFNGKDLTLVIKTDDNELYAIPGILVEELEDFEPFLYFVQGLDSTIRAGDYDLFLEESLSANILSAYQVEIPPRDFRRSEIPLDVSLTAIRTNTSNRRVEEGNQLQELLNTVDNESRYILGTRDRIHPITEVFYTSLFGNRRIYVYSDGTNSSSVHNGLDYRAAIGEPVLVPFDGQVVMAENRIVTGNTVVLGHLPGVYSLYYHLDSMSASIGDVLTTGAVLGTAGDTGLATGSHLHWEIRVRNVAVDPEIFLEAVLLDNMRLIDILNRQF